ncbi:hypothetical protein LAZ67_3000846 [Cordylochernes scorpioides]|uniref:Sarcoglycan alpha/epsilon second domain-containing protein n=1 Tax=Cordylochernes scorpioides TaxID=51811 RepID=A0ABY6K6G9_9ARAC|nr:hypothetical protein LAZ67_3000846 [Cordylochernes scorpioides]
MLSKLCLGDPISIFTTEAFHLPILASSFTKLKNADSAREYRASLMDLPDLPQKVYIRQPNGSLDALLYGVVANPGPMNVEIIAMDKYNYDVEKKVVEFDVRPKLKGREDVNDEERAGRPSTSTTDEKINEVEKMILANRRITVREVAEDLNISIGSCHSIFINDLGMRRVAAKFVPKLLNCDQKQHRMNISNEMLDSIHNDPNLLQRVITGDEAGVVHHEFLPQGRTVNKEYYLQVMRNLHEAIRQKRPGPAQYHVELKLRNVNVEDMVLESRLAQLVEIFRHHLWPPPPDGGSVYITQLTSTVDVGGRLPLNPMEKEGVMIRVGASYNYSLDLQGLAREVQPLRTRVPCPRDYRRTSAEHLFRRRGFISDWCHFSLVTMPSAPACLYKFMEVTDEVQVTEPNQFRPMVVQDTFHLRQLSFEPRNIFADFVLSLLVPGFLLAVLLGLLGTAMCRRAFTG